MLSRLIMTSYSLQHIQTMSITISFKLCMHIVPPPLTWAIPWRRVVDEVETRCMGGRVGRMQCKSPAFDWLHSRGGRHACRNDEGRPCPTASSSTHKILLLSLSVGVGRKHTQEVEDDDDEMLEEWPTARKPSKQGSEEVKKGVVKIEKQTHMHDAASSDPTKARPHIPLSACLLPRKERYFVHRLLGESRKWDISNMECTHVTGRWRFWFCQG
jgi:hypothetical protein